MPTIIDAIYAVLLLVVGTVYEFKYFWPRFRVAVAADRPGARTSGYQRVLIGEWAFAIAALIIWSAMGRIRQELGLTIPHGWRLLIAIVIVVLTLALFSLQLWSVVRLSVERRIAARPKLGSLDFILPRTARDYRWFLALSITAGFCEELLYRGYLPSVFVPWLGRVGALLFVAVLFGVGHLYQGPRGAIKATLAGMSFVVILLVTGSVIPGMIVHALVDMGGGTVGYLLFRDDTIATASA
jgi:CAAX protease family protein